MSGWIFLMLAIVLEVAGTTSMKFSDGFTRLLPSVLIFVFYAASFVALVEALKQLDLGLSYAVWAGSGTAIIAVIGIVYFHEAVGALKLISLAFIIFGVIGLRLSGEH
jgi:small multidrug resistance pump